MKKFINQIASTKIYKIILIVIFFITAYFVYFTKQESTITIFLLTYIIMSTIYYRAYSKITPKNRKEKIFNNVVFVFCIPGFFLLALAFIILKLLVKLVKPNSKSSLF